ncbi:bZIP transcription factor [Gracilaria domingensis]|nr:bZIP transcription factor [Gracilaria domingensis]
MPTTDNIIAELDMYTSAISTPLPSPDDAPSPVSDVSDSLFRSVSPSAPIVGHKRAAPSVSAAQQPYKKQHIAKHEQLFEPVTPTTRKVLSMSHKMRANGGGMGVVAPLSPSQSLCTEEDTEARSVPPTPAVTSDASSGLPVLSKEATAKRRALRRAAMKRNRSRREDGCVKTEASAVKSDSDVSAEPVDKKAARAIRNREAAMKSRVEAKQKMQKLQDENDSLKVNVKSLADENKALKSQMKSLLQHTYGVSVGEGQDVQEVFNMLAPVGCRS